VRVCRSVCLSVCRADPPLPALRPTETETEPCPGTCAHVHARAHTLSHDTSAQVRVKAVHDQGVQRHLAVRPRRPAEPHRAVACETARQMRASAAAAAENLASVAQGPLSGGSWWGSDARAGCVPTLEALARRASGFDGVHCRAPLGQRCKGRRGRVGPRPRVDGQHGRRRRRGRSACRSAAKEQQQQQPPPPPRRRRHQRRHGRKLWVRVRGHSCHVIP